MKGLFSAFLPLFLFMFFTIVLFLFLKNDNVDPLSNKNVKDIFEDVKVNRDIKEPIYKNSDDLKVINVRWHQHDGFERIVFDVSGEIEGSFEMGTDIDDDKKLYGKLIGYSSFAQTLPSFDSSNIVKEMEVFAQDYGYSFRLVLYRPIEYKLFALKNPSRIVIDMY